MSVWDKYNIMEQDKAITGALCDACDTSISPMPQDPRYAFAYIRFQQYGSLFSPEDALTCGTYFKDLSMPYIQRKGDKNGNCK